MRRLSLLVFAPVDCVGTGARPGSLHALRILCAVLGLHVELLPLLQRERQFVDVACSLVAFSCDAVAIILNPLGGVVVVTWDTRFLYSSYMDFISHEHCYYISFCLISYEGVRIYRGATQYAYSRGRVHHLFSPFSCA